MNASKGQAWDLANFAAEIRYSDLPKAAVETAKKSILDSLGVILAASGIEPDVNRIIEVVRENGGPPESSILGFRHHAPVLMAAFAKGALAHCLDFDDHTPFGQHASTSIIPAVFAVAERKGKICGRDMIAAIASGLEHLPGVRRRAPFLCGRLWSSKLRISIAI